MDRVQKKQMKKNIEEIFDNVMWHKMDDKIYTDMDVAKILDYIWNETDKLIDSL